MSRVGRKPITIPSAVKVNVQGSTVTVKGPKGELHQTFDAAFKIVADKSLVTVELPDNKLYDARHGLTRALINNMVVGVTEGFTKSLEIQGVGYRAESDKQNLTLNVGYSNPVVVSIPEGISVDVEKNTLIHVRGIDKQQVGEMAARIRRVRKPEPYRGKGIRYLGEQVRRKVGKAGGK